MSLRDRLRQQIQNLSTRRDTRSQPVPAQRDGAGVSVGGNRIRAQNVSNEALGTGDTVVFSTDSGVVQQERRKVAVPAVSNHPVFAPAIDCTLPGIMVYQYIVTYFRPSSYYASFDSELHVTERIIWFTNNGNKTTLYERISAPNNSAGFPEVQLASKNHFWANTDGTGQVCFRYRPTRTGPEFDDIWDLTPESATRISSQQSPPNSEYKGGSLGVLDTIANPGYLLRENPRTVQNSSPTGGSHLSIEGTNYPIYERHQNGVRANGYISTFPAQFCSYMPTMAGKYPLQYSLDFQPGGISGVDDRQTGFSQNGHITALVTVQTYILQADGSFEPNTWASSTYISARPIKLNIGTLGNFNQFPSLPIPPFNTNERYWISSEILVDDITPNEGIGSSVWVLGSYLNASKNCLIKNSTDLVKVAFGTVYVLDDPHAPI
jgi:hypothetical protein